VKNPLAAEQAGFSAKGSLDKLGMTKQPIFIQSGNKK